VTNKVGMRCCRGCRQGSGWGKIRREWGVSSVALSTWVKYAGHFRRVLAAFILLLMMISGTGGLDGLYRSG
jgi:hypothetical protein